MPALSVTKPIRRRRGLILTRSAAVSSRPAALRKMRIASGWLRRLVDLLVCYGSVISTTRLFSITIFPRLTVNLFVWLRVGSAISNVTTLPAGPRTMLIAFVRGILTTFVPSTEIRNHPGLIPALSAGDLGQTWHVLKGSSALRRSAIQTPVPPISSASRVKPDARNPTATIILIFIRLRNYKRRSKNHLPQIRYPNPFHAPTQIPSGAVESVESRVIGSGRILHNSKAITGHGIARKGAP